jgi:hypothetical protein
MYRSTFFLASALVGGEWSASRPGRCTPGKELPVPIVEEVGYSHIYIYILLYIYWTENVCIQILMKVNIAETTIFWLRAKVGRQH